MNGNQYKPLPLGEAVEREKRFEAKKQRNIFELIANNTFTCPHCRAVYEPEIKYINERPYPLRRTLCNCEGATAQREAVAKTEAQAKEMERRAWLTITKSWNTFDTEWPPEESQRKTLRAAKARVLRWYNEIEDNGLLLVGPVGVGKSHLLRAVHGAMGRSGHRTKWITEPDALSEMRGELGAQYIGECKRAGLLIIDDLGLKTFEPNSAWLKSILIDDFYFPVIDCRAAKGLLTIFSTNQPGEYLENFLGARVYDRVIQILGGKDKIVSFDGVPSYRRKEWK